MGEDLHRTFGDSVNAIVRESLACPGDRLEGFLVHGATRGKAHKKVFVHQVPPAQLDTLPSMLHTGAVKAVADSTAALHTRAHRELSTLFDSTTLGHGLRQHTDLLGALEVASDEFAAAPAEAGRVVYFFSDMNESMNGPGRRDFDVSPPRSRSEAEKWARTDAAMVATELQVSRQSLQGAEVRIILGDLANRHGAENVRTYWAALLNALGIPREDVRFN
ncbi:MAG TPA: hypothetical protein VFQ76_14355 [Longimicrobiaceae bacterium]|nr:hypothetical protein [Longimicrobiaceae bacterium]